MTRRLHDQMAHSKLRGPSRGAYFRRSLSRIDRRGSAWRQTRWNAVDWMEITAMFRTGRYINSWLFSVASRHRSQTVPSPSPIGRIIHFTRSHEHYFRSSGFLQCPPALPYTSSHLPPRPRPNLAHSYSSLPGRVSKSPLPDESPIAP
jgi:hypothetical protein